MQLLSMIILWIVSFVPENTKLLTFSARTDGSRNIVEWRTASEKNLREFIIERSTDGALFTGIAWITPKGAINGPGTYRFTDTASTAQAYYRLRMVEANGKDQVSKVLTVTRSSATSRLNVYPVFATSDLEITVRAEGQEQVPIVIIDANGKEVRKETPTVNSSVAQVTVDVSFLPAGTYYVQSAVGNEKCTAAFVKKS